MAAGRPSVVAIFQSPTPYYTPILNELADRVPLHVMYVGRTEPPGAAGSSWADFRDAWGEPPRFERSAYRSVPIRIGRLDFHARFSVGVGRHLGRLHPDVVLAHSWGPLMVEPLVWARLRRRRSVMWTESGASTGLLRDPVSMAARRRIVGMADAFVSSGSEATRFAVDLGADPTRVITSCLPSALAGTIATRPLSIPAGANGLARRFLFVGRFIERKRPVELAEAFLRVAPRLDGATMTFVGDGPLRPSLQSLVDRAGGAIRVEERVEGADLADRFLVADVLVVPSVREVWGLVVNEGLAAGLFVVATDQVAAAMDLLDRRSGLIVPADDPGSLADALLVAANADQSVAAREARRETVSGCTPAAFADAISRAIELAWRGGDRRRT